MENSNIARAFGTRNGGAVADQISAIGWGKAMIGVAAVMLIPDSADAQPVSSGEDLPQVRVTAPKQQARRRTTARRAPARTAPAASAPSNVVVNPVVGDGAGVAGYQTPAQSGLSRFPTSLRNTPQTVNVVSQQLMQDQRVTNVQEALRNVPGITFTAGEGGIQGDNITIRGYTARNDFYRDGIRDPGWYARDAFSFDRVEVFKGPSSFLFGRGSTGGVINIVSKTPQNRDFGVMEATGTSATGGRMMVDFNKVFGDFATRISAVGYDSDVAGRDFTNTKRVGVAPSISYQIAPGTKNTLSYIYQKDDNIPDRGLPMMPGSLFGTTYRQPAAVPRNTWYGVRTPGQEDVEKTEAHNLINKFEHEFYPGLKFTNTTGVSYVERFNRTRAVQPFYSATNNNMWNAPTGGTLYTPANPVPPGTPLSNIWIANTNHYQNQTDNFLVSNVSDVNAKFRTGAFEHNLLVGLEVSHETRDNYRTTFNDPYRVNVAFPNPWSVGTLNPTTGATESKADALGIYIQDQMKITEWLELLGGVRVDNFSANSTTYTLTRATGARSAFANLKSDNSFTTYRAGVVLHPTQNSSVYYMRGTSANPPAEFTTITNGQQALSPVQSEIDEVGIKADFLNNRLTTNAAIFRIKKTGDIEQLIANDPTSWVPIGNTQVEGFEAGMTGKLTDQWSISAGYTYLNSKVVSTAPRTASNIGHELAMTPKNSFSVWSTYDLDPKWTIGGGAFFVDSRWNTTANDSRVPSYWRFDAMAAYKLSPTFTLQLNIYNIADERYYDTVAGAGFAVPGPGRYVALSGRASF